VGAVALDPEPQVVQASQPVQLPTAPTTTTTTTPGATTTTTAPGA